MPVILSNEAYANLKASADLFKLMDDYDIELTLSSKLRQQIAVKVMDRPIVFYDTGGDLITLKAIFSAIAIARRIP